MGGSVGQRNRADSNDVPKGLDEEVFGVDGHHQEGVEAMSARARMRELKGQDCGERGEDPGIQTESRRVWQRRETREGGTWKVRRTQKSGQWSPQKGG